MFCLNIKHISLEKHTDHTSPLRLNLNMVEVTTFFKDNYKLSNIA